MPKWPKRKSFWVLLRREPVAMEATGLLNHTGNRRGAGTGTVEGLGMFKMLVIHS